MNGPIHTRITVILETTAGELDRATVLVEDTDDAISQAVFDVIETWTLSVGDTIRIEEAQS